MAKMNGRRRPSGDVQLSDHRPSCGMVKNATNGPVSFEIYLMRRGAVGEKLAACHNEL